MTFPSKDTVSVIHTVHTVTKSRTRNRGLGFIRHREKPFPCGEPCDTLTYVIPSSDLKLPPFFLSGVYGGNKVVPVFRAGGEPD